MTFTRDSLPVVIYWSNVGSLATSSIICSGFLYDTIFAKSSVILGTNGVTTCLRPKPKPVEIVSHGPYEIPTSLIMIQWLAIIFPLTFSTFSSVDETSIMSSSNYNAIFNWFTTVLEALVPFINCLFMGIAFTKAFCNIFTMSEHFVLFFTQNLMKFFWSCFVKLRNYRIHQNTIYSVSCLIWKREPILLQI